jgi:N-acetylneuraminic acid mutarotase
MDMPWNMETPLEDGRQNLAAATCDAPAPAAGYRIYAIGGSDFSGVSSTVEIYDTLAKTWSTISPLPTARQNLAAASGPGRLFALGGDNGASALTTHETYDPAAGAWSAAPPLLTARSGLAAALGRDGRIYAIGGRNPGYLTTVEVFDPVANTWTTAAAMPTPRAELAAVTGPDGLIYAIGGQNDTGNLDVVEIFNPVTNTWATGPSLPAGRTGLAAAVGPDGLIYAFGGDDPSNLASTSVFSYDPTATAWVLQSSIPILAAQAFLAGVTGPDGLVYAIGGEIDSLQTATVEALTVATTAKAPDPYIGNGTYQSPDIILVNQSTNNVVPIGGAPGGAWDTLLIPYSNYTVSCVVYNDANVAAPNTKVRFWHFPGGVGTDGALISEETVTVPPNSSIVVTSSSPFQSGAAGTHECAVVSLANAQSPYFNIDPTTATEVIDPTVPHPAGSAHFGSAWRNTNSVTVGGEIKVWNLSFAANSHEIEPALVKLTVTANKVAVDWDRTGEMARIRKAVEGACSDRRLPLFLVPEIRAHLPSADCDLRIHVCEEKGKRPRGGAEHHVTVRHGESALFEVSGRIPDDARTGDIFLVNVAAHYPAARRRKEAIVEYLEVIYVK